MSPTLDAIRECLDGSVPATVATCAADGTPNVTYVSEVHYVDNEHVALSFQFFNKTRQNIVANPRATVIVINPTTAARYRLRLKYERTETEGPLFERMKAKLAGIASHTGMSGVFRLLGSDVYRVDAIDPVSGRALPFTAPPRNLLAALRALTERLSGCTDLKGLLDAVLEGLESHFGIRHAMVLMLEGTGRRLYTVASRGYPESGVGSEIAVGSGVIGVAAAQGAPIRITHMTAEYSYSRAIRESIEQEGMAGLLETAIPLPGLADCRSQLAAPIIAGGRVIGVLYVESSEDLRFGYDDEDALVAVAAHIGMSVHSLEQAADNGLDRDPPYTARGARPAGPPVAIRHYPADDSIFVGDEYLIKGVAGAIFRKLLTDYTNGSRTEFTNRELRLDPALKLPDLSDNLEARLILLERRLAERCAFLRIEKTGRGRFRLAVARPFNLIQVDAAAGR